jgi:hypothetical protein
LLCPTRSWKEEHVSIGLNRPIDKRKKKMPATQVLEKSMKMGAVKTKAKNLGIAPKRMKKAELIHAIQMAEGCTPCFGRSNGQCPYGDCCFMADCLKIRS